MIVAFWKVFFGQKYEAEFIQGSNHPMTSTMDCHNVAEVTFSMDSKTHR